MRVLHAHANVPEMTLTLQKLYVMKDLKIILSAHEHINHKKELIMIMNRTLCCNALSFMD